jgi:hypothetical protein
VEDATPVRFVHVGGASGEEEEIALPGTALRSSAIQLMGSGAKSVPPPQIAGRYRERLRCRRTREAKPPQRSCLSPKSKMPGKHRRIVIAIK